MRLADWPRMPFLNDELRGWIAEHLAILGIDEEAVFAVEEGPDGDGRRVLVATELALVDYRYGPRASTARFAIVGRFYPWPSVRGVDFRVETNRLWALEHTTRWWLQITHPAFRAATDDPELGQALADFAKVAVLMGEPAGSPASAAPEVAQGRAPQQQAARPRPAETSPRPVEPPARAPGPGGPPATRPAISPGAGTYTDKAASLGLATPSQPAGASGAASTEGATPASGPAANGDRPAGLPVGPGPTASASRPRS